VLVSCSFCAEMGDGGRGPSSDLSGSYLNSIAPPQHHLVDTTNILFILSGAFVGLEKLISKRIEKGSIGFTARIAGGGAEPSNERGKESTYKKEKDMLEWVEPEDLVRFGFIPE
jgi:ATP-dependent Clp protease ATP-binding subunit ClpX